MVARVKVRVRVMKRIRIKLLRVSVVRGCVVRENVMRGSVGAEMSMNLRNVFFSEMVFLIQKSSHLLMS